MNMGCSQSRAMGQGLVGGMRCLAVGAMALAAVMVCQGAEAVAADMGGKPDFSGVYMPYGRTVREPAELPFTKAAEKMREQYLKDFTQEDDDPGLFCVPSGMPGAIWGAPFAIEIFHRPQDLTIYFESYSQYRKIFMRDYNPPGPATSTRMGYSEAEWDGDTLVIDTDSLSAYPYFNRIPISSEAKIHERLHQEERTDKDGTKFKVLVDELTLTDPTVYTEPIHIHAEARLRPDVNVIEYTCGDTLWEQHLAERGLEAPDIDALGE